VPLTFLRLCFLLYTNQPTIQPFQVRFELKSLESYGAANTPAERQKLLVTLTQEYMRHLSDCVRGEYRDRLIVTNPDLRLYTRALNIFTELQVCAR
jgi:interferon-induced GTP-binding protein Mx1